MIKAILFDLDGVLVDTDRLHFEALNIALNRVDQDPITWQEHLNIYKGIPTRKKLEILTKRCNLPRSLWDTISREKQKITKEYITKKCQPDPEKIEMCRILSRKYRLGVCTNAVRETLELMLEFSGLKEFFEVSLSNEDVKEPKPSPEIYLEAFKKLNLSSSECVIVEDSDIGKQSAIASGGILCPVTGAHEVNYYRVLATIQEAEKLNVVIPAAGQGKRFSEQGYQHPKPLIDVAGKPMIELVLKNLKTIGEPIIILQENHVQKYCADKILKNSDSRIRVVNTVGVTQGAACSVLLAKDHINNSNELIIANSDQYLDFDLSLFVDKMRSLYADGGILTFKDTDPKWSFAKIDKNGLVVEVAEKKAISDQATVGIYYFKHGKDFVEAANSMINKNIRVNDEFYVCPVFNEIIQQKKRVFSYEIAKEKMHGLGTPEDLNIF